MGDSRLGHEHDAAATPAHVLGVTLQLSKCHEINLLILEVGLTHR